MDELATAILDLSWSDLDDFAEHLNVTTVNNAEVEASEICPRYIAQILIDWAHDNKAT